MIVVPVPRAVMYIAQFENLVLGDILYGSDVLTDAFMDGTVRILRTE
jgi:hypothetical protein